MTEGSLDGLGYRGATVHIADIAEPGDAGPIDVLALIVGPTPGPTDVL